MMSQCVPTWDVEVEDDQHHNPINTTGLLKPSHLPAAPSNSMSTNLHVPIVDYEVTELTWKNGQVAMHGLGPPRVAYKHHADTAAVPKYTWNNSRAAETLETIVNQATHCKPHKDPYAVELVPWLDHHTPAVAAGSVSGSATMTTDALVPHALPSETNGDRTACSTRVGSCSSDQSGHGGGTVARECRDQSVSGSETFSSRQLTVERELGVRGFTSTSMGSPEKSTSPDEHYSVSHSGPQMEPEEKKKGKGKSSISTKRSRAAAIHNQSERRRRDKINRKMKTLQMLVPKANKTDKASILDEVIEYLKQLQAQIHMMGRMSMSPMMMPLAMQQQQLQMAMMNPMGMGIGMGMGMGIMDLNAIGSSRPNIPGMSPVFHPSPFMQPMMASWDMHATGDRVQNHSDPMAAFLACQSQPMTTEGYNRMVALYQQMHNQSCYSGLKK